MIIEADSIKKIVQFSISWEDFCFSYYVMIKCTAQAFMVEAINYMHAGKKRPLALKTNTETSNHYYFENAPKPFQKRIRHTTITSFDSIRFGKLFFLAIPNSKKNVHLEPDNTVVYF